MSYQNAADVELLRLVKIGWTDWQVDDGVGGIGELRTRDNIDETSISFPVEAYETSLSDSEAEGFWAQYRANQISRILSKNRVEVLWEVGSGNGKVAIPLRDEGIAVIGIEPIRNGAEAMAKLGFVSFWGLLADLDLPDNSIKAIGIFDVLEHLAEPQAMLTEILRVLEPGGLLITTVPANQWLFSDFDVALGHYRRYSRKSLLELLNNAGFQQHEVHFMFGFLVPVAFLLRSLPYRLGRNRNFTNVQSSSDRQLALARLIGPVIKLMLIVESHVRPFTGLSLLSSSTKVGRR